jgi:hypothetical protein
MRHPELPRAHVFVQPGDLSEAERLRGVRYDRVFVDSLVPRQHGWKWADVKQQIMAWCTKPETIWIES